MIEQIVWTRIDTMVGVAGMMRRLLNEAVWHTRRRSAFGAPLASQPAMVNVLADLALEAEAAASASFRVVRAFDEGDRTFGRMALAVMKYWICKRGAPVRGRGARVPGRQRLHRDAAGAGRRSSTATSRSARSGRARAT